MLLAGALVRGGDAREGSKKQYHDDGHEFYWLQFCLRASQFADHHSRSAHHHARLLGTTSGSD
jgi:hypothetical protein